MMFELAPFARDADYGEAIVPLADMKDWVSVDQDEPEFDNLLGVLRDAGIDMVEQYCSVRLGPCLGLEWRAEALPDRLRLPIGPVTEIVSFDYLDSSGAQQTVDVSTLRVGLRGEILPVAGQSWPSGVDAGLAVVFNAGFDDTNRPPALVTAVKMFAGHLFANREAVVATGTIGGEIPLGFRQLCGAYRNVVI